MSDEEKTKIPYWLIATPIGPVGLNQGISKVSPNVRNDPFTGTQGAALERRLDSLEADCRVMGYRSDKGVSREHAVIQELQQCCRELRGNR